MSSADANYSVLNDGHTDNMSEVVGTSESGYTFKPSHNCTCNFRCACCWAFALNCLLVGIAAIVLGCFILPPMLQDKVDDTIKDKYVPIPGTEAFKEWLVKDDDNNHPLYRIFWFFNITNANDVLLNSAPPTVQEVGPFVYRQHVRKISVDGTVAGQISYKEHTFYEWIATPVTYAEADGSTSIYNSLDPDTTMIAQVDAVLMGVVEQFMKNPYHDPNADKVKWLCKSLGYKELKCLSNAIWLKGGGDLASILKANPLITVKSANKWLGVLEGSAPEHPLLKVANEKLKGIANADSNFAYFYNNSQSSVSDANKKLGLQTVRFDREKFGDAMTLLQWNGHTRINTVDEYNKDPTKLNVLDYGYPFAGWGKPIVFSDNKYRTLDQVHPDMKKDEMLTFWLAEGARPATMVFLDDVDCKGVSAYRYTADNANYDLSDDNVNGFFSTIKGFSNESQFKFYAPALVSNVHFINYDSIRLNYQIFGLSRAEPNKHMTFVDVEPTSGMIINAAERLQLNWLMPDYHYDSIGLNWKIQPNNLIPSFWFEVRCQLGSDDSDKLKLLQLVPTLKKVLVIGGAIGGALLIILGIALTVREVKIWRKLHEKHEDHFLYKGVEYAPVTKSLN